MRSEADIRAKAKEIRSRPEREGIAVFDDELTFLRALDWVLEE